MALNISGRTAASLALIGTLAVLAVTLGPSLPRIAAYLSQHDIRFKGFDVELWGTVSPVIQAHVMAAVAAFGLGLILFLNRKGSRFHKLMGWTWVGLMATTAGSSLFITGLNGDHYSLIHGLTAFTLLMLPIGVMAARRHDVVRHRRTMTGLFLGALIVAGAFTFLPGRLMWSLFFGT